MNTKTTIATAEECYYQVTGCVINHRDVKEAMIAFAKMHVEAALKAADAYAECAFPETAWENIDEKYFIMNAYPLENIK